MTFNIVGTGVIYLLLAGLKSEYCYLCNALFFLDDFYDLVMSMQKTKHLHHPTLNLLTDYFMTVQQFPNVTYSIVYIVYSIVWLHHKASSKWYWYEATTKKD